MGDHETLALQRIAELKTQIDAFHASGDVSEKSAKDLRYRFDAVVREIGRDRRLSAIARMVEFIV